MDKFECMQCKKNEYELAIYERQIDTTLINQRMQPVKFMKVKSMNDIKNNEIYLILCKNCGYLEWRVNLNNENS